MTDRPQTNDAWVRFFRAYSFEAREGWQEPPYWYRPHGAYNTAKLPIGKGQFPAPFVVVDETWTPYSPFRKARLIEVKLHKDADQKEKMKPADEWFLWPNKRKLSEWHNEPFRRMTRMAFERMTEYTEVMSNVQDNHYLACAALKLQELILADPEDEQIYGDLDWSPSTQVWLKGRRWVKIDASKVERP